MAKLTHSKLMKVFQALMTRAPLKVRKMWSKKTQYCDKCLKAISPKTKHIVIDTHANDYRFHNDCMLDCVLEGMNGDEIQTIFNKWLIDKL